MSTEILVLENNLYTETSTEILVLISIYRLFENLKNRYDFLCPQLTDEPSIS